MMESKWLMLVPRKSAEWLFWNRIPIFGRQGAWAGLDGGMHVNNVAELITDPRDLGASGMDPLALQS